MHVETESFFLPQSFINTHESCVMTTVHIKRTGKNRLKAIEEWKEKLSSGGVYKQYTVKSVLDWSIWWKNVNENLTREKSGSTYMERWSLW